MLRRTQLWITATGAGAPPKRRNTCVAISMYDGSSLASLEYSLGELLKV
jgi:hypothetical protein